MYVTSLAWTSFQPSTREPFPEPVSYREHHKLLHFPAADAGKFCLSLIIDVRTGGRFTGVCVGGCGPEQTSEFRAAGYVGPPRWNWHAFVKLRAVEPSSWEELPLGGYRQYQSVPVTQKFVSRLQRLNPCVYQTSINGSSGEACFV